MLLCTFLHPFRPPPYDSCTGDQPANNGVHGHSSSTDNPQEDNHGHSDNPEETTELNPQNEASEALTSNISDNDNCDNNNNGDDNDNGESNSDTDSRTSFEVNN